MTDISRPPLEQGTALMQLWEAADDLRAAQTELATRVQDHSMVVGAASCNDTCATSPPAASPTRPSCSARTASPRDRDEALVQQVNDRLPAGQDALSELRFGLPPNPEGDANLEARATEHLRERFRRRTSSADGQLPEDPRPRASEQGG